MSREAFKVIVTADQPEALDYFVHDAILNRKERASLGDTMEKTLKPLSLDEVLALGKSSGAQFLDVRDGIDFEGGDLPPLNGTASRERIWGWSTPREAINATRKEGTG